jgi:hypothetical protein
MIPDPATFMVEHAKQLGNHGLRMLAVCAAGYKPFSWLRPEDLPPAESAERERAVGVIERFCEILRSEGLDEVRAVVSSKKVKRKLSENERAESLAEYMESMRAWARKGASAMDEVEAQLAEARVEAEVTGDEEAVRASDEIVGWLRGQLTNLDAKGVDLVESMCSLFFAWDVARAYRADSRVIPLAELREIAESVLDERF